MKNSDGLDSNPPVPEGTQPLPNQVAGHIFGKGKTKLGFLKQKDGIVLKPIHGAPDQMVRRQSELSFYEKIFNKDCDDPVLMSLRPLVPTYYGTWQTEQHPGILYLQLEDITSRFRKPCIMDVKMGRITYAPDATAEKITHELAKYPPARDLGFTLLGMRIYQQKMGDYRQLQRSYLWSLTAQQVYDNALSDFLKKDVEFNRSIAKGFLKRLQEIEAWFLSQDKCCFFASSLLFVYEGDVLTDSDEEDALSDIRMIDFPRVFPAQGRDENYLCGLQNLIGYFERIAL